MKIFKISPVWLALIVVFLFSTLGSMAQSGPPALPTDPDEILNIWMFDNGPLWTSTEGDAPISFTNLTIVPGWSPNGTALQIDTNAVAWLNYSLTNSDGSTNVTFDSGTIMLWYSPDFTTVPDGGSGPGEWASLVTIGNFTTDAANGCWSLAIDPAATNLVFVAQTNGASQLVLSTPIDWFAGDWHFIALTYTPTNCQLYLESELITNAPPISYWPSAAESAQDGIWVGSTKAGDSQGHGIFQYLVTFNYAVDADFIQSVYQKFSAEISDWGGSLPAMPGSGGSHTDSSGPPPPPGTNSGSGGGTPHYGPQPTLTYTTNYALYTNFWLTISNSPTQAYVTVESTLSNLTYQILTNATLNPTNWHVWKTLLASNSATGPSTLTLGSNYLFFEGRLVWSTGTNGLPDWWQMLYFDHLGVNQNADPMQDGLSNLQKYQMGLNPNVSYLSQLLMEPPGGTNTSIPQIKIFSLTNGATIRYTTNGSNPSATNGFTTTSGLSLTNVPVGTFTLKAWEAGFIPTTPIAVVYTVVAGAPIFSLPSGVYPSGTQIQIACLPTNAIVRYTTNSTLPTTNSPSIQPTNIVTLLTNETLNATAWYNGVAGPISSAGYIISSLTPTNLTLSTNATPIFVPDAGTYTNAQLVSILCNVPGSIIRYTTNGVSPATNSPLYNPTFPLLVFTNTTLKAAAWPINLPESAVYSATYSINTSATNPTVTVSTPTISPANTNFASSIVVTLTCTNTGARIHYNLLGNLPTISDPSVASGGTVTITNTAVFTAKAWVSNMNASAMTNAIYAKNNIDTLRDGIPDTGDLQIGANPLESSPSAVNSNPFAHGLDNLQVYQNPSILLANNYSTLNDGVPDWWKVKNGYNINTVASLVGANGQTLLADYLAQLNPNNSAAQPSVIPLIDFHLVTGPTNNLFLVVDSVVPGVIRYALQCLDVDPASAAYDQTLEEWIPTNTALLVSNEVFGRFYPFPTPLPGGTWTFKLYGSDAFSHWSNPSACFAAERDEYAYSFDVPSEATGYAPILNASIQVVAYTNQSALKEQVLAQDLRATTGYWEDFQSLFTDGTDGMAAQPQAVMSAHVQLLATTNFWGVGQFDTAEDFLGPSSYFTNFCATPNAYQGCPGSGGAGFAPLIVDVDDNGNPTDLRMSYNSDQYGSGYLFNQFGLECLSLGVSVNGGSPVALYPGQSTPMSNPSATINVAQNLETPIFHAVNYYVSDRVGTFFDYPFGIEYSTYPGLDAPTALPGWNAMPPHYDDYLPVAVTNPVIVAQVGRPVPLQTWREVMAYHTNGEPASDQTFWIEQDLDKAYLCDPATGDAPRVAQTHVNGQHMIDTNNAIKTGIVSPDFYSGLPGDRSGDASGFGSSRPAEFTPTQPGKVIITTKTGLDGDYGEIVVYVIDMQVDANHDGLMDNRDLTSLDNPMQFWVNNDIDRWHTVDITDEEQDDLAINDTTQAQWQQVPDCAYGEFYPYLGIIPSTRDLEDYTRLWVPGLSNLMQELPSSCGVSLQWRNNTGAGIRVFPAADADGGTNYLFATATASNQINYLQFPCLGYVTSNQTISMTAAFTYYSGSPPPGDHFIFCGTQRGQDELVLQVTNQWGGLIGEASVFLELSDIKEMYERWSVGENPYAGAGDVATNCPDGMPPGVGSFQYSYNAASDSTMSYILFVHGWNEPTFEKDRFAETAFKRLYWQGYQGRFGLFRWPTYYAFPLGEISLQAVNFQNFDNSEFNAWQSGLGLEGLLTFLNSQYPGHIYVFAHSMGNIVTGEALRQAGTRQLVNTYVALQAAVAAHTYDPSTPNRSGVFSTPDRYAQYWTNGAPSYFNGVACINFFNTNDWALVQLWAPDQNLKPDSGYSWNGTNFYSGGTLLQFPGSDYMIFSYCDQAPCNALGAQANVGGAFRAGLIYHQVDLAGLPFNFSTQHKYHSGEFRSDNMDRASVWDQVLRQMQLK